MPYHLAMPPYWSGRRGSNSRPPPWQGGVLPLNYFRKKWLGYQDSNLGMTESKSVALPLGYTPIMGRLMGIEPTNAGTTIRCVNHFATIANINYRRVEFTGAVGIEPTSKVLETSILPLNYAPINWWRGTDSNRRTLRSGFTVRRV